MPDASVIAEKAIGANAHAASVRLGIVQGSLVYTALVADINSNIHSVLVDPGNGKVLAFSLGMGMFGGIGSGMGVKAHVIGPTWFRNRSRNKASRYSNTAGNDDGTLNKFNIFFFYPSHNIRTK
jgi:hypothetical protein